MNATKRSATRLAAAGVLGATAVLLAATTASAAGPAVPVPSAAPAARAAVSVPATITAHASVGTVRAWQEFRVTGKTTGLRPGASITLQQKQRGRWVSLPASAPVHRDGTYSLRVKLGLRGVNQLRIVSGSTASPVFQVTVG
ncbi:MULTISPECIES: hypothetical protein [Streptomycetaceae]|uniref:Uncharacterized protein n=1 Tax=Streptantibioticus cattleyicolor (strain ATCC 35852 / DSM 46488 / JCM 4925 / NBRC 14057 / NRRL 8057) TaxID=1003195 RepID=F8JQF3_STREN|nr:MULTISPECIES: hypothetical protein [Streptomycetaceae]AEW97796.1 hypothetical protein SCATT_54250 [Streptantibioticus cattleyicolor NRRL 8057 = DSM 46488]MYS62214.1 hypothetical protein [Streptomyces sp. SID5468]CCB78114.1 exported protein of unknown function [Streptantibioticus cattleyicolor NRRL 8057 = DSM 46488]